MNSFFTSIQMENDAVHHQYPIISLE